MYSVSKKKKRKKWYVNGEEVYSLLGFVMPSKKKSFSIGGVSVANIKIVDKDMARPLVSKSVSNKFKKLINLLTELLISDDDSGDTFREALNQIEKFRLEIAESNTSSKSVAQKLDFEFSRYKDEKSREKMEYWEKDAR